jgi:mRNA interferase HigB
VHIISRKKLVEFAADYPDASSPLMNWYRLVKRARWENFAEVREVFPSADQVGKFTVFNIGGNKYRLIVVIHFNRKKVFVRSVLTHKQYDKGEWKGD